MTETPMDGPSDQDNWIASSDVARAIVAVNRYVEGKKKGRLPEEVLRYLADAEGNGDELRRRLKLIGATLPKEKQTPPRAAPGDNNGRSPAVSSEEIAARMLW